VRSLPKGSCDVDAVDLLGHPDALAFEQTDVGLEVVFPETAPCDHAFALRLTGQGLVQ